MTSTDDGYHSKNTSQLLDGLKERGVKATFFVTGVHAEENPEIIKRMKEEGHLIGNHTYSHMQLRKNNREEFKEELIKTNDIISEITGEEVLYVRPPYGSWDKSFEPKQVTTFVEVPPLSKIEEPLSSNPSAQIRVNGCTIEIAGSASDIFIRRLLGALAYVQ